jgi:hypothetical protein
LYGGHVEIVGRRAELDQVDRFLGLEGPAAAVLLDGEAGIGKTTIWREGLRRAHGRGLRTLVAHPSASETGLPYAALADLLAGVPEDAFDALPKPQRAAVDAALARSESAAPFDPHALARATADLLSGGPLVVAIDDVQWLDAPTAAVLTFAFRRLGAAPLRILLSRRAGTLPPDASLLGVERWERPIRRIDIGPLAPTELGAMLREALGVDLPRPRVELIARASGGNPMFALELARQPVPGGALPSFAQTLAARIRELDPAGRVAVTTASAALQPSIDLLLAAGVEERGDPLGPRRGDRRPGRRRALVRASAACLRGVRDAAPGEAARRARAAGRGRLRTDRACPPPVPCCDEPERSRGGARRCRRRRFRAG